MMQDGFIFLVIIWISSPFASGNTTNLQFSLGCQAVIPCENYRSDSNSLKWIYKKEEDRKEIQLYLIDRNGIERLPPLFRRRGKVLPDGSLVIDPFTEDDQGLYWCKHCFQDGCRNKQPSSFISVKKEILKESLKTVYIIAGSTFTYSCPSKLTNLKWTFEASSMTVLRSSLRKPESKFVTSNKSLRIVNVTRADAGKYSCWKSGCDGHSQKLLTINLCVITVDDSEDSSVSCAVMCDTEFSNITRNNALNVEIGTRTISVFVDPHGSLNCTVKQMFKGHSAVNTTHGPSDTLHSTTGVPTEPGYQFPVIYGTSVALVCLILIALLVIWYLRPRLQAAFPVHVCCCGLNGRVEEETPVVYSSIVIRRPAKTTNIDMTYFDSSCVYSEIKI
ncbi:hypothetical protein ABVT39_022520 [Epinephelus coioides]